MSSKNIIIRQLSRTSGVQTEKLEFKEGVNVVAGPPNAGKTKWFQMFDYLMGDSGKPEDAFSKELADKYDSAFCLLDIEGEDFCVERRWKETGKQGKVFVNGTEMLQGELSAFILEKLGIPVLHYPKGNPFAERSWPELSWREMLRHVYRQERFWSDIADRQPESVQHACLTQFLGIAKKLFSPQLGELVNKQKQLFVLQTNKEQFLTLMGQLSRELGEEDGAGVFLTSESLDDAISRLNAQIEQLDSRRQELLIEITRDVESKTNNQSQDGTYMKLGQELSDKLSRREHLGEELNKSQSRLGGLVEYNTVVADELGRLQRTSVAGSILSDLRVTHCPVCDQQVSPSRGDFKHCYLCSQPYDADNSSKEKSNSRIDFEISQLTEENSELVELRGKVQVEIAALENQIRDIEDDIYRLQVLLKPARNAVTVLLPPEMGVLDRDTGRLMERIRQLGRLKSALRLRDELSGKIDQVTKEVDALAAEVAKKDGDVGFEQASDVMSDGMNTYLNELKAGKKTRWPEGEVRMQISERRFNFTVAQENWASKLGATFQVYFLISYHYALLNLSPNEQFNGVGLTILDFPPQLIERERLGERENFMIEPFVKLLNHPNMAHTQLIVIGRAFENLEGAHRIELNDIW